MHFFFFFFTLTRVIFFFILSLYFFYFTTVIKYILLNLFSNYLSRLSAIIINGCLPSFAMSASDNDCACSLIRKRSRMSRISTYFSRLFFNDTRPYFVIEADSIKRRYSNFSNRFL